MGLSTGQVYSYPSPTRGSSSKVYRKSDLLIKLVGRKKDIHKNLRIFHTHILKIVFLNVSYTFLFNCLFGP